MPLMAVDLDQATLNALTRWLNTATTAHPELPRRPTGSEVITAMITATVDNQEITSAVLHILVTSVVLDTLREDQD